jgi:hypothetical protein
VVDTVVADRDRRDHDQPATGRHHDQPGSATFPLPGIGTEVVDDTAIGSTVAADTSR